MLSIRRYIEKFRMKYIKYSIHSSLFKYHLRHSLYRKFNMIEWPVEPHGRFDRDVGWMIRNRMKRIEDESS